jgi:formylglycine-generating enzyme required for sulfatase activity
MCTGRPAFQAGNALAVIKRVGEAAPRPVREVNPAMPAWLAAVVEKLMAKDPADRFTSADEVAEVLRRGLAGTSHPFLDSLRGKEGQPVLKRSEAVPPAKASLESPSQRRGRKRWWIAAGVGVLVLLAVILAPPLRPGHSRGPVARLHPPGQPPATFTNRFGMEFVRVPKGAFRIGGGAGASGGEEVEIPYDFYLGKYEVTQEQWQAVTGGNPSHFSRTGAGKEAVRDVSDEALKRFPVESVDLHTVEQFVRQLNKQDGQTGWKYDLPMTAEWEYACRGGPTTDLEEDRFHFYLDQPTDVLRPGQANFAHVGSLKRTCPVGGYAANRLGLHEMHGNVAEWCHATEKSPHGMPSPVYRGGGWDSSSGPCRASSFQVAPPVFKDSGLGVRIARVFTGGVE